MIKNKAGSKVNLKSQTIGSFRRAMNSFKITTKENASGFSILVDVGLDSNFSQLQRSRGDKKIDLFDIYDKSNGKNYKIKPRNSNYLRFEIKNFRPKNPELNFIKTKNGFIINENGKWIAYMTEVKRTSFHGFGIYKKEEDFSAEFSNIVIQKLSDLFASKIDNEITRKVKKIRKK